MWACWVQSMGTGLSVLKGFSNIIVKASIDRDMSLQGFQEHGSKLVSHPYLLRKGRRHEATWTGWASLVWNFCCDCSSSNEVDFNWTTLCPWGSHPLRDTREVHVRCGTLHVKMWSWQKGFKKNLHTKASETFVSQCSFMWLKIEVRPAVHGLVIDSQSLPACSIIRLFLP